MTGVVIKIDRSDSQPNLKVCAYYESQVNGCILLDISVYVPGKDGQTPSKL